MSRRWVAAKRRRWLRVYKSRMTEHLEQCRNCDDLATTFDHITPWTNGGRFEAANITLLCSPCNHAKSADLWPWLKPLTEEPDFNDIVYGWTPCEGADAGYH